MSLDKNLVEENSADFNPTNIADEGFKQLIKVSRDEAIEKVRRLYEKEYHSRNEVKKCSDALHKAQESLDRTTEKITKFKAGDLSVLFKEE